MNKPHAHWSLEEEQLRVEPSWYGGRQEWLYKKAA